MKSPAVLAAEAAAKKAADKYIAKDGGAPRASRKDKPRPPISDEAMIVARFILNSPPKAARAGITRDRALLAFRQMTGLAQVEILAAIME